MDQSKDCNVNKWNKISQDKSSYARRKMESMRASTTDDNAADDDLDAKDVPFIYGAILRISMSFTIVFKLTKSGFRKSDGVLYLLFHLSQKLFLISCSALLP